MTITNRYLQEVIPSIVALGGSEACYKPLKGGYEVPCPFCCTKYKIGAFKRRKRVGIFLYNNYEHSYHFTCMRCGKYKMPFPAFLKEFDSNLFNKYHMERFHAGTTGKGHTLEHPKFKINKPKFEK